MDVDKKSFSALKFKRMTFLGLFPAVLSKKARDAQAKVGASVENSVCTVQVPRFFSNVIQAKRMNLGGNMTVGVKTFIMP